MSQRENPLLSVVALEPEPTSHLLSPADPCSFSRLKVSPPQIHGEKNYCHIFMTFFLLFSMLKFSSRYHPHLPITLIFMALVLLFLIPRTPSCPFSILQGPPEAPLP